MVARRAVLAERNLGSAFLLAPTADPQEGGFALSRRRESRAAPRRSSCRARRGSSHTAPRHPGRRRGLSRALPALRRRHGGQVPPHEGGTAAGDPLSRVAGQLRGERPPRRPCRKGHSSPTRRYRTCSGGARLSALGPLSNRGRKFPSGLLARRLSTTNEASSRRRASYRLGHAPAEDENLAHRPVHVTRRPGPKRAPA